MALHFLSLSKLKLFREAKKVVLKRMDSDVITPERAEEIFNFLKETILQLKDWNQMRAYPELLANTYPELKPVAIKLEFEEREHIDKVLALFVESIVEKGDFDLASKIIDQVHEFNETKGGDIEEIRKVDPGVFDNILTRFVKED